MFPWRVGVWCGSAVLRSLWIPTFVGMTGTGTGTDLLGFLLIGYHDFASYLGSWHNRGLKML